MSSVLGLALAGLAVAAGAVVLWRTTIRRSGELATFADYLVDDVGTSGDEAVMITSSAPP